MVRLSAACSMEYIDMLCTAGLRMHHQEYEGLTLSREVNGEPAGQSLPMQAPERMAVTLRMHSSASPSPDLRGPGCVPVPGPGA
jgi:hypothetical protein